MKQRVFAACCGLIALAQAGLIAGLVWFERLAYYRAGVNHHVAFRKRQYNQTLFTEANVALMRIALIALLAALTALLLFLLWRRASRLGPALCALSLVWTAALLWGLTSPAFQAIRIYPYAMLGLTVGLALWLALLALWPAAGRRP